MKLLFIIPFILCLFGINAYANEVPHNMDGATYTVTPPNSGDNNIKYNLEGTIHIKLEPATQIKNFTDASLCPAICTITTKYNPTKKSSFLKVLLREDFHAYGGKGTPIDSYISLIDNKHPAKIDMTIFSKILSDGMPWYFHIENLGCNDNRQCTDPTANITVTCTEPWPGDPQCYKN